jgi:hypothetical protein
MNRITILLLTLLIVVGVAIGMTFYLRSSTPAQNQQGIAPVTLPDVPPPTLQLDSNSKEAVQAAYKSELAKHPGDNTKLYQTVISGDYALQLWSGNLMGGEALLKFDHTQGKWILIDGGGGVWSLYTLLLAHVPRATAMALLAGVPH